MALRRNHSGDGNAAEEQSGHVRRKKQPERNRRRSDHELELLKPDDFVDEGSETAEGGENKKPE